MNRLKTKIYYTFRYYKYNYLTDLSQLEIIHGIPNCSIGNYSDRSAYHQKSKQISDSCKGGSGSVEQKKTPGKQ